MLDNRRAGRGTVAGHDVDHAVGNAGLLGQPGHPQAGERRLLGRLHHDRAAGGQGRAPFPGHHQHREIPGNDLPDHAHRLASAVAEVVAADRNRLAVDLVGVAGVVAEHVDHERQIAMAGFANRLAVVERFERGQLVDFFFDQVGQLEHQAAPVAGIHPAPGSMLQGVARRFHRQIDVGRIAFGHLGNDFFGGRVDRLERLAADGGHPMAADEALGLTNLRLTDGFCHRGHA